MTNDNEKRVVLHDTTLRDGEQSPGVFFTPEQKLEIAGRLDSFGVDLIEAGTPAMGGQEADAVTMIATAGFQAEVFAWCRAVETDIETAVRCSVRNIHVSFPVSDMQIRTKLGKDRNWILNRLAAMVRYARGKTDFLSIGAEDASRADPAFLSQFVKTLIRLGADRFRYCDTVGILDPFRTYAIMDDLTRRFDIPIEFHGHNDFGMATANTLAAVSAGAASVNVTVNGLGERAGNAALEEVVMALRHLNGITLPVNLHGLLPLCRYVSEHSGRPIAASKPISGTAIFRHESGIHADGVLKNPQNYEPFPPEEIGCVRSLPIGKHTGSHSLRHCLEQLGIPVTETESKTLVPEIEAFISRNGRLPEDNELIEVYLRNSTGLHYLF